MINASDYEIYHSMVNVVEHHTGQVIRHKNPPLSLLKKLCLALIALKKNPKPKIAFFIPEDGLAANFGDIPKLLSQMGNEVYWFYGQPKHFQNCVPENSFLIIDDMITNVGNIDVIVTATVMDCLPKTTKNVLVDHISFAPLQLEHKVNSIYNLSHSVKRNFNSIGEVVDEFSAYLAFLPFFDAVLTPSKPVSEVSNKIMELIGYHSQTTESHSICLPKKTSRNLNLKSASRFVDFSKYKNKVSIIETGYPKLDRPCRKYATSKPESLLIYAPTPTDNRGNKDNCLWNNAITIRDYGAQVLSKLCESFPDKQIVFKPYKDEANYLVSEINKKCNKFPNYIFDQSGSDYWDLYSKAELLISDFSSTAYSFAIGMQRPVIFFSPNENKLPNFILEGSYCAGRPLIGDIAHSVSELGEVVNNMLINYKQKCKQVKKFSAEHFPNTGNASAEAARVINAMILENLCESITASKTWYK